MGKITTINYSADKQSTSLAARDKKNDNDVNGEKATRKKLQRFFISLPSSKDVRDGDFCIIDENKLEYRAEGNANIVFAISENKQVLRVRKSLIDPNAGELYFYNKYIISCYIK